MAISPRGIIEAIRPKWLGELNLQRAADWLAVCVVASLPWSTSATSIFVIVWLVFAMPTSIAMAFRRMLFSAAGKLPVLLWALAVLGMLYADATWHQRFSGLGGFNRMLVIPLLLVQFSRSKFSNGVFLGFLASTSVLLLVSFAGMLIPNLSGHWARPEFPAVPVKDYVIQSTEFLICAFGLLEFAFDSACANRFCSAAAMVLAALFLGNILFVITSRTALPVIPILVVLLGWRRFRSRGAIGAGLLVCIFGTVIWLTSPHLRDRLAISTDELRSYETQDAINSTGLHLDFLRKSLLIVESAPLFGHGTGSIPEQFRNVTSSSNGSSGLATANPHNQIFGVAIQIGLIGAAVLIAMWLAHFLLFCSSGLTAWIGTVVVVQNVISSLFNSHLFDFAEGWLYVFGVGVAGGVMLREKRPSVLYMSQPQSEAF
jgi:O-antigen ligase